MNSHRQGKGRFGQQLRGLTTVRKAAVSEQRHRLIEAMLELAGERGYAHASVTALAARAGLTRKVFHERFPSRRDLLLEAFDTKVLSAFGRAREVAERPPARAGAIDALVDELCLLSERSRGTLAIATIEVAAANPSGLHRRDDLMGAYGRLLEQRLSHGGSPALFSPSLCQALAGGMHRTVLGQTQLDGPDRRELGRQLSRWVRSYEPLPAPLARSMRTWGPGASQLLGGRAPGTLRSFHRDRIVEVQAPSTTVHSDIERIFDALAQLNFQAGYIPLTVEAIATQAGLSEHAFRAYFRSKNEAFAAALEIGHMKALAVLQRSQMRAPDWAASVRAVVQALFVFLSSEPFFTRMAFVDAPLAGAKAARRAHERVEDYARLLFERAPRGRRPAQITAQAATYSLFELAFHYATQNRIPDLVSLVPEATYLALAPFLGAEQAIAVARS